MLSIIYSKVALPFFCIFALVSLSLPSFARQSSPALELSCTVNNATSSDDRDPIVSITVALGDNGWTVIHTARSGAAYDRSEQYFMHQVAAMTWQGTNLKRPNITMVGVLHPISDGQFTYEESIFDKKQMNARIYDMLATCFELSPSNYQDKETATSSGSSRNAWNASQSNSTAIGGAATNNSNLRATETQTYNRPLPGSGQASGKTPSSILWTVEATTDSEKGAVCDAFASGQMNRPPYEFRLRQSFDKLILAVSYEGPKIPAVSQALIKIGNRFNTFPAVAGIWTKDSRPKNTAIINLGSNFDLSIFQQDAPLSIKFDGSEEFNLALLASDRIADKMSDCISPHGVPNAKQDSTTARGALVATNAATIQQPRAQYVSQQGDVRQSKIPKEAVFLVISVFILVYILFAGFRTLGIVRPPLINWYNSQVWIMYGRNPVEIFFKHIGYRLVFELFILGVAIIFGALGGWLLTISRSSRPIQIERANRQEPF